MDVDDIDDAEILRNALSKKSNNNNNNNSEQKNENKTIKLNILKSSNSIELINQLNEMGFDNLTIKKSILYCHNINKLSSIAMDNVVSVITEYQEDNSLFKDIHYEEVFLLFFVIYF